ncbi:MAG: AAA family ATPase [Bacteroidales bacterium]|nr:AAA family ATPase [Bacteroidales bacterium]
METIIRDRQFDLAEKYVEETSVSVFLTGKAGTGKTTFLRYIVEKTSKRCVVLAPTGVAAVNAQGSTIHSFFSLPLCPYLPDVPELKTEYQMPERLRKLKKEKIKIIRTLDLLIIDEISMVRADLLDAVDATLRRYRRSSKPFGGVQLLMIGDARQLSPVVTEAERSFIGRIYPSPYFFHSKALQQLPFVTIELETIHRQEDADFIEILNAVRDAHLTRQQLMRLNARVGAPAGDDWIRLTTHNAQADGINNRRMEGLPGDMHLLSAEIDGDFPENLYPAAPTLSLKEGARVMFIRNDADGRFFNGKLGTVKSIEAGAIVVTDDEGLDVDLERVDWENLNYALNAETGEIEQEVKGVFRQFPLRPAWAVTIHKSQGLTFDHVVIDAGAAFAFGQVYVALSRCRSLERISLTTPISPSLLLSDADVAAFNASFPSEEAVEGALDRFRQDYKVEQVCACFDFGELRRLILSLKKVWKDSALPGTYSALTEKLEKDADTAVEMEDVAARFRKQLQALRNDPDKRAERIAKACDYFLPLVDGLEMEKILSVEVDNAEVKKRIKNLSAELLPQLQIHRDTLREVQAEGFDSQAYRSLRLAALLEDGKKSRKTARPKPVETRDVYNDNRHPELVEKLIAWRREKAKELGVPSYCVLHQKTLMGIADAKPDSRAQLLEVWGFGPELWKKFGLEILKVLSEGEAPPSSE